MYGKNNIVSIYDYFICDYLESISKLPLKFQFKELYSRKILALDFCGMICKYINIFNDADIFLVEDSDMSNFDEFRALYESYDVIYILKYELQDIILPFPVIEIIFYKNKLNNIQFNFDSTKLIQHNLYK